MMRRPTIYTLLGPHASIRWDNGDRINELRFINVLSQFADVYYNGVLYRPGSEMAGRPGPITPPEPGQYDLVYVRANPEVFQNYQGRKIYLGLPYDAKSFNQADAIAVTTEIWRESMAAFPKGADAARMLSVAFPRDDFVRPRQVINIGQSIDQSFDGRWERHSATDAYRVSFGWGFTIGYFGRLFPESMPHDLIACAARLRVEIPGLNIVFGGTKKTTLPAGVNYIGRVPYPRMKFAISACDLVVCNQEPAGEWLGAGKVLDALACRTPILSPRHAARYEQLGEGYPLYFSSSAELGEKVARYHQSAVFRLECAEYIEERRALFLPDSRAEVIRTALGFDDREMVT